MPERIQGELTPKRQVVLRLVARGLTNEQIAERLGQTQKSVEMLVANIRKRLGLPAAASLRHAMLAMQYNEIRELLAREAEYRDALESLLDGGSCGNFDEGAVCGDCPQCRGEILVYGTAGDLAEEGPEDLRVREFPEVRQ